MWELGTGPSRTSKPVLTTLLGSLREFISRSGINTHPALLPPLKTQFFAFPFYKVEDVPFYEVEDDPGDGEAVVI